ncbi:GntR family transcriptional regulator [Micromonospora sp. AP08]|uniref:GntR family transcriptional regulator n=1 Tax=Micromonospora sp. AP08 TaxID=2604467 RepID=UPI0011D40AFF|nr:GntR family transcriptional regulator [Micromonospora sp. AP08]TYB40528.1 GntR family transcriptional regulator [Micromonospora sp. AP08]
MPAPRKFEPHYRRIIADIRGRIASGEWPPGHKLPSTKALADLYEVGSQSTVLIETGELYGHQGLGVFVADPSS